MRMQGKRIWSICLIVALLGGVLPFISEKQAAAAVSRVAVVKELKGTVQVKKSGGSKAFKAFVNMSLGEGDVITTAKGASVRLELASAKADQDEVTIGENAQVDFTKLSDDKGTKSKMKVWAGSLWVKVKSISNASDTFEVETPTSIMGVRGTQFMISYDPATGYSSLFAGSGILTTAPKSGKEREQHNDPVMVYPAQQILLPPSEETDEEPLVSIVDLEELIRRASPGIIEQMLRNANEIEAENEALLKELLQGGSSLEQITSKIPNLDDYKGNLDQLLANIAKAALQGDKLSKAQLDQLLEEINASRPQAKKIDPEQAEAFKLTKEQQAERERVKKKQEAAEKSKRSKEEQLAEQMKSIIDKIKQNKEQQKKQNEAKLEERQKQAEQRMLEQMTPAERAKFEADKERLAREANAAQPMTPGGNTGGGSNPDPDPEPTASPTATLTTTDPVWDISEEEQSVRIALALTGMDDASIAGFQAKLSFDRQYVAFDETAFVSDAPTYRSGFPGFVVEPQGTTVAGANSTDHYRVDGKAGTIFYAAVKYQGGSVEIADGKVIAAFPFAAQTTGMTAGETYEAAFVLEELIAVDEAGEPVAEVELAGPLVVTLRYMPSTS
ncbi:FecR domain-containing protein [Paenibacillus sp. IB182496]|uniref:FecR domain-containing protein n=1 Tax=Paenibacillus sabuli TaxID=2772509 RepID=A0A927GS96_9BACL|nr:FecR family protein [Paenibacillus sabuli]MBD2846061.1 FecR domain-containing protein [Paenibacillus sabuli]